VDILEQRSGYTVMRVSGDGENIFLNEFGGHRWQRVPPNEAHGRVHTSTVTVATFREPSESELSIKESDLQWKMTRGSGPGGQNRNKVETEVVVTHVPTQTTVRCGTERSQFRNRQLALGLLRARIFSTEQTKATSEINANRKQQVGSGMRGDKRRTIRMKDGIVTDHVLERKMPLQRYLSGEMF